MTNEESKQHYMKQIHKLLEELDLKKIIRIYNLILGMLGKTF